MFWFHKTNKLHLCGETKRRENEKYCTDTEQQRKIHHGRISWKEWSPFITQIARHVREAERDGTSEGDADGYREIYRQRCARCGGETEEQWRGGEIIGWKRMRGMKFLFLSRAFITSGVYFGGLLFPFASLPLSPFLTSCKSHRFNSVKKSNWFPHSNSFLLKRSLTKNWWCQNNAIRCFLQNIFPFLDSNEKLLLVLCFSLGPYFLQTATLHWLRAIRHSPAVARVTCCPW